jgi:hypothetical protein
MWRTGYVPYAMRTHIGPVSDTCSAESEKYQDQGNTGFNKLNAQTTSITAGVSILIRPEPK